MASSQIAGVTAIAKIVRRYPELPLLNSLIACTSPASRAEGISMPTMAMLTNPIRTPPPARKREPKKSLALNFFTGNISFKGILKITAYNIAITRNIASVAISP